jgi:hypothetical protein
MQAVTKNEVIWEYRSEPRAAALNDVAAGKLLGSKSHAALRSHSGWPHHPILLHRELRIMAELSDDQIAAAAEVGRRSRHTPGNSGEWLSTLYALLVTIGAGYFFWAYPNWHSTEEGLYKYIAPWLVLIYLGPQIYLLMSALRYSQNVSILDLLCAVLPAGLGALLLMDYVRGNSQLSGEQLNLLFVMIGTSLTEAGLTLKTRFEMKGRTFQSA